MPLSAVDRMGSVFGTDFSMSGGARYLEQSFRRFWRAFRVEYILQSPTGSQYDKHTETSPTVEKPVFCRLRTGHLGHQVSLGSDSAVARSRRARPLQQRYLRPRSVSHPVLPLLLSQYTHLNRPTFPSLLFSALVRPCFYLSGFPSFFSVRVRLGLAVNPLQTLRIL